MRKKRDKEQIDKYNRRSQIHAKCCKRGEQLLYNQQNGWLSGNYRGETQVKFCPWCGERLPVVILMDCPECGIPYLQVQYRVKKKAAKKKTTKKRATNKAKK